MESEEGLTEPESKPTRLLPSTRRSLCGQSPCGQSPSKRRRFRPTLGREFRVTARPGQSVIWTPPVPNAEPKLETTPNCQTQDEHDHYRRGDTESHALQGGLPSRLRGNSTPRKQHCGNRADETDKRQSPGAIRRRLMHDVPEL